MSIDCRSTTSSVGDSGSYSFTVPHFAYPPVSVPWYPWYQSTFLPMPYPWYPCHAYSMDPYVHNGACGNSPHLLEDASNYGGVEASHSSSSFYPPPGLDLAQPDDHTEVQVKKVEPTVAQPDDATICVVCMDNKKDHAVVPCGHRCICGKCADDVQKSGKCPMCRSPLNMVMKLWE